MNNQSNSTTARDMIKGAIIGAAIASVVAVLANEETRKKITKSVKDKFNEMKKRKEEMGRNAKEKYEKTMKEGEDLSSDR